MPNQQRPKRNRRARALVGGIAVLGAAAAAAEPGQAATERPQDRSAAIIDEIVVVANKHERSRRDVTANVTVISAREFHFELASSIADVFRYAPGIDYESDRSRFGSESINIRGIAGNRVAILVDGVPVSDQFDVGSFSNATRDLVNAGFIDQVEVLHGPASALYGSSAIGGVVTMNTVDPRAFTLSRGQAGRLYSSGRDADSSLSGTALHAVAFDSIAVLAGLSGRSGHESDPAAAHSSLDHRDFSNRSALLKLVADDARGNTWRTTFYHGDGEVQSDARSLLGTGRFRSTTVLLGDDVYETDIAAIEYRFSAASGAADDGLVRAWFQASGFEQKTRDERALATRPVVIDRLFVFEQDAIGLEANLQKVVEIGGIAHRLTYGFEARRRETEEYRDGVETGLVDAEQTNVILGEVFPLRDFPVSRTDEWGVFAEDTFRLGRWSLTAALRADHYKMRPAVDAMYAEDYPFAEPVAISEFELSPKAGLIYHLGPASEIYLQYSRGFRAPPYEDANISLELPLFNIRAVPNPELRSENSDGLDLGARWRGIRGSAYVSVFRTEYTDFIESKVRLGTDPESGRVLFQSQNIASAAIEGIEAGATIELGVIVEGLSFDGGLFVARSENRDNGEPLNSVGPPQAVAGIGWLSPGGQLKASLRGTFTDDWSARDESAGELFDPPGHAVFDLYLAWRINRALTLRAGAQNLTDKTYWAWTDVRGLSPDDPVIPYLSHSGRNFSLGVEMAW
jgi:hemoglobin/transferrin/lactoferrin receptor protein